MLGPEDLTRWAKAIRDLGNAGAIILVVLFLIYTMVVRIVPALDLVPTVAESLAAHRRLESANQRAHVETCIAVKALARQSASDCLPKNDDVSAK